MTNNLIGFINCNQRRYYQAVTSEPLDQHSFGLPAERAAVQLGNRGMVAGSFGPYEHNAF